MVGGTYRRVRITRWVHSDSTFSFTSEPDASDTYIEYALDDNYPEQEKKPEFSPTAWAYQRYAERVERVRRFHQYQAHRRKRPRLVYPNIRRYHRAVRARFREGLRHPSR